MTPAYLLKMKRLPAALDCDQHCPALKGTKVIYGSATNCTGLKLTSIRVCTRKCTVINGAVDRLAGYSALPSYFCGAKGDSKIADIQTGHA